MLLARTAEGQRGLDALRARPTEALIAVDYDGTLAPIVADPSSARPADGAVDALIALAGRVGGISVITGRQVEAVLELGGLDRVAGIQVLGQYGVQHWHAGELTSAAPDPGLERARAALRSLDLVPGAQVEDKGLSLAVHTRQADDPIVAQARLHPELERIAVDSGLTLHLGRMVLELRPTGFDKGRALMRAAEGLSTVLFAGDDLGDLAAYDVVDHLRSRGNAGVLVCSDSAEAPAELRDRADLVVPGPVGVVALLRELASVLER